VIRNFNNDLDGTATRTVPLFRATKPGRLTKASWSQELAVDGAKTVKIRNETRAADMTAALTINGLGALGSGVIVVNTDGSADIREGDLISCVYTVTTAGTVAAAESGIELDIQEGAAYISGGIGG
jgi:hypothetical protein